MQPKGLRQFSEATLREFYRDPVMAAAVLLGWELDYFQACRLRYDWWFPETIDDSGVSTGKTLGVFCFVNLRAILIPDNRIGVYFPNFQTAKEEFWPYFAATIEKSDFYRQQLKPHHGKLGEHLDPGAWWMEFKNLSRVSVPAPGHSTDGANQATRRFNTLVVDDWRRCEEMGDAIAKQLIDRVTRPTFNPEHPIWGNHIHFKGHAEGPSHKSHWRVKKFKRQIADGSTRHAIYSFCYRDVSPKWRKKIRPDHIIRTQRTQLPSDQFQRQWLGLAVRGGKSYYPDATLARCCTALFMPLLRREVAEWMYSLGFDVAPGQSIKADYSSAFIYGFRRADGRSVKPTWIHDDFGHWQIVAAYAHTLSNKSAGETSAFIHWLHERFAFSAITTDPGGGGLWVYKEIVKPRQTWVELGWHDRKVIPLCTPDEMVTTDKQPIFHFFKRGVVFDGLSYVHPNTLVSDDGFLFAHHQRYQEAWHAQEILYPASLTDRAPETLRQWTPDELTAQRTLDKGLIQLSRVRQLTSGDGNPLVSKRGFPLFGAMGKKDIAYSSLYAFAGMMQVIERPDGEKEEDGSFFSIL